MGSRTTILTETGYLYCAEIGISWEKQFFYLH